MTIYSYDRRTARELNLSHWGLEGLTEGKPVVLYHGTTKLFRRFDMSLSRDELVNKFYGRGIFLTPKKRVAVRYAEANRNIGFDPSIIADLKRKNRNAGEFLEYLYKYGQDGWEAYWKDQGFWNDNPGPGEGSVRMEEFEASLGVPDSNLLQDIADYILGSKSKPLGSDGPDMFFSQGGTGLPEFIYDDLDAVGLNSKVYRPKVYTVEVRVDNPLITASKSDARKARSKGYDSVVYFGSDLVEGVPEVAVFNPRDARIRKIEVV